MLQDSQMEFQTPNSFDPLFNNVAFDHIHHKLRRPCHVHSHPEFKKF